MMPMHPMYANTKPQHEEQEQHAQELKKQVRQRRLLQLQKWQQQCEAAGSHDM